jgi:alpha-1,3-glucan synthase
LNESTPFTLYEHDATWIGERQYLDFKYTNQYNKSCTYPRFWGENGLPVVLKMTGCYNRYYFIFYQSDFSDFDQYGDTEAFGVFPDWQRQLTKFASVQDRLREWKPSVGDKIKHFTCMVIAMLDIDGFRIDKTAQITIDYLAEWGTATHACARQYGKNNFYIPGEVTGGDTFGALYMGRGRQPNNRPADIVTALTLTNTSTDKFFMRPAGQTAIDGVAFHYSMYRALTRFLGMDGNLEVAYDTPVDFTDMWNVMALSNDFVNGETNKVDPRHMYGVTNQDVFRWPAIINGIERQNLGSFACVLVMPGTHSVPPSWSLISGVMGRGTSFPHFRQHRSKLPLRSSKYVLRSSMARSRLL